MRQSLLAGVAVSALLTSLTAIAEVATDGTMGARARLTGRDVTIGADLGTIRGKNLFHSFDKFDIETGGSATFTGPAGLDRVISRVTGRTASSIDGTLRSTVPGADVYLINPSGILFGPNARLDVPASFHASTADELRFPDGGVFSASRPERSVLSVAAPEAFGFLGARPASIVLDQGRLEVGPGKSLSLVGGNIGVRGTGVPAEGGLLRAPGGELTLASLGGKGEVSLGSDERFFDPAQRGAFRLGAITLLDRAQAETTGDGGGKLRMRGGDVVVASGTQISANNSAASDANGGIIVDARRLAIDTGSSFSADALAEGDGGDVRVAARTLTIADFREGEFTGITSNANRGSSGAAGGISLTIKGKLTVGSGAQISSSTFAAGDAGGVIVDAAGLAIDGARAPGFFTGIASSSEPGADGAAGDIAVEVGGRLRLVGGAGIDSNTTTDADAGKVFVRARNLTIDGQGSTSLTGIASDASGALAGDAGPVEVVVVDRLRIIRGAKISSSTFGSGDAGTITVKAQSIEIDRQGDANFTGIVSNAEAGSSGNAGATGIEAGGLVRLVRGGAIASSTFASGEGGLVAIAARDLEIDRAGAAFFTGIASQAASGSTGPAGGIVAIARETIGIRGGGQISGSTSGTGNAGTVVVKARNIRLQASASGILLTGITSQTNQGSTGNAGTILVQATEKLEFDGGQIQSSSFGTGAAGDVTVVAADLMAEGATIGSSSDNDLGGLVKVFATDQLLLLDAEVSTNGTLPADGTSAIVLAAPTVVLLGKSSVTALTGDGEPLTGSGIVAVGSRQTLISEDSRIEASSDVAIVGLVNSLRTPERPSTETPTDPSRLLRDCAEERLGGRGSFKASGRGGLPASPEEFLTGRPANAEGKPMRTPSAGC